MDCTNTSLSWGKRSDRATPRHYREAIWILWGVRRGMAPSSLYLCLMERSMPLNDLSRSLVALEQETAVIAVIEMGQ